ncbi:hypothetical protein DSO57_1037145 [Entomophthora muscae]|uniref:Uncharacterized protein n=1 Tax=Entomophthora muscae TaxID=34485 RepID=A0ACC2SN49_9FUNG|nr:hypothetical protein DSO57_1037145 [Entomophthora muscae]
MNGGFLVSILLIISSQTKELVDILTCKELKPVDEQAQASMLVSGNKTWTPNRITQAKYYVPHVGATMCPLESLKKWDCSHCKRLSNITLHTVVQDPKYDTLAYVTTNNVRREIVISFRGTHSIKNWIQNLNFIHADFDTVKYARVHAGFKSCSDGLTPLYLPSVRHILQNPEFANFKLVLTGHSLGGAIAVLSTLNLQKALDMPWSRLAVYTYGQPRIGNSFFSNYVNSLPLSMTRVVNENDPIPHLPPLPFMYLHQHTEVHINNGVPKVCSTKCAEDPTCSLSRIGNLSFGAHRHVFDIRIGKGGC